MSAVIEIAGLRKTFHTLRQGRRVAVDGFDMLVEAGQVHGFLGPNGSGKTTTLRALLGLVRPDAGRMRVLGAESPEHLPDVAGRVGAIVESPQFFANFTAHRTLRLLAVAGGVPTVRVDEVLSINAGAARVRRGAGQPRRRPGPVRQDAAARPSRPGRARSAARVVGTLVQPR